MIRPGGLCCVDSRVHQDSLQAGTGFRAPVPSARRRQAPASCFLSAALRGVRVEYVVGDHSTEQGQDLLSPTHLEQLVPDIAERDVYICGPAGMIDDIVPNLRRANVPRGHRHVERFAL